MNGALQSSSAVPLSAALRSFAAQWQGRAAHPPFAGGAQGQARAADPLSAVREQAMRRFLDLGLPTSRNETWRYTNLRSLAAQSYVDAPRRPRGEIEPNFALSLLGKSELAGSLSLVNGYPSLPA